MKITLRKTWNIMKEKQSGMMFHEFNPSFSRPKQEAYCEHKKKKNNKRKEKEINSKINMM